MNLLKKKISVLLSNDWVLAGVILVLFLLTNRYVYGWDDQHLEIPLLKHLIDPALYNGDYYVEALKENFTSFLYPLLARFISVESIPFVYLILYLISRYFFFFWIFCLWKHVSGGSRFVAFFCTATIFLIGRTEELIYRTFSHQEFALGFIFAAIFFFYKDRFFLAACILGFSANFHALYALYPMMYLFVFLLFFQKESKWRSLIGSVCGFVVFAFPFIFWTFQRVIRARLHVDPHAYDNWQELYVLSCPQTFIFGEKSLKEILMSVSLLLGRLQNYLFMITLYVTHCLINEKFRHDFKMHAFVLTTFVLISLTFVFSYIFPSHFVLDLNLVRNEQYVRILLSGYTVLLLWQNRKSALWKIFLLSVLLAVSGGKDFVDIPVVLTVGALFFLIDGIRFCIKKRILIALVLMLTAVIYVYFMRYDFLYSWIKVIRWGALIVLWSGLAGAMFLLRKNDLRVQQLKTIFFVIPFFVMFLSFCHNHYVFVQISQKGGGFWQLQRNWENMQKYVKENTPKDALIMAPNDMEMGGFRIHSDRRLLVDYRDCGIIGFDMAAATEWQRRMKDIDAFKVIIREPFLQALMNGIVKYRVDYVVFMKYAAPMDNAVLKKMYENDVFSLYQVKRNG